MKYVLKILMEIAANGLVEKPISQSIRNRASIKINVQELQSEDIMKIASVKNMKGVKDVNIRAVDDSVIVEVSFKK